MSHTLNPSAFTDAVELAVLQYASNLPRATKEARVTYYGRTGEWPATVEIKCAIDALVHELGWTHKFETCDRCSHACPGCRTRISQDNGTCVECWELLVVIEQHSNDMPQRGQEPVRIQRVNLRKPIIATTTREQANA